MQYFNNRKGGEFQSLPILKLAMSMALLTIFVGCGGGSGGGTNPPPPPVNQTPSANAGDDQTVTAGEDVELVGTGSDSDGSIASFSWRQTEGTSVTLIDSDSANASFEAPDIEIDETLTFELEVVDDDGASGTDTVDVLVKSSNRPPNLELGERRAVQEGLELAITAQAEDPDGTIVSFAWSLLDERDIELRGADTEQLVFTAPFVDVDDILEFELIVVDNEGASTSDTLEVEVKHFVAKLNDTGITTCGDFASGASNIHGNRENCQDQTDGEVDPIPGGQDGHHGLDLNEGNDEDGHAGFDFTKLDEQGLELANSATEWSCVRDNNTGMIWQVKQRVGGLHDTTNTYTWLNFDETNNGGDIGTENGGSCSGSNCDTASYVDAINEARFCGGGDWSLPSLEQLRSIADYSVLSPGLTIDSNFFPNSSDVYWSSTPEANRTIGVWTFSYFDGSDQTASKNSRRAVRLVRFAEE